MHIGVLTFVTDEGIGPVELGEALTLGHFTVNEADRVAETRQ